MFVNISNHPSANWSKDQLAKAGLWGKVMDYPFPTVDPYATIQEIQILADKVVENIISLTAHHTKGNVLHIMGEMTLCFLVVSRFQTLGYRCVASTTTRQAVAMEDGTKVSRFQFVQFRDYKTF